MVTKAAQYIDMLVDYELRGTGSETNHSIYDKRRTAQYPWEPFKKDPYAVYFYYLVFQGDNRPRVDHFMYNNGPLDNQGLGNPIPPDKIEAVIAKLADNARSTGIKNPRVEGNNFKDVVWRRISYIVILLDEDDWYFQRRVNGDSAVVFNLSKGSTPNHSFFDARDITVQIPNNQGGTDTRTALLFINHMKKNADGEVLMSGEEQYYFDAYVDVSYAGTPGDSLKIVLDPGGTNQGPPIEP